jgi:hypothetical protein
MASALVSDPHARNKAVAGVGLGSRALMHRDIFVFIRREPRREWEALSKALIGPD